MEGDPPRPQEEPVHGGDDGNGPPATEPVATVERVCGAVAVSGGMAGELPDFHIPHAEKIEWMIETDGFAVEPVRPAPAATRRTPAYTYTIGFREHAGFPDVVVFGLTPVAARGLLGLVADLRRGGTEIPLGVEVVGLLDNELRARFVPVDLGQWGALFEVAASWYRGDDFEVVQLIYPDRNGFLPYEPGFDQRMRFAQPVIGDVT